MKTEDIIQILSDNLKALKEEQNLKSGLDVEKQTGISKAQVNNLIAKKHAATIATLVEFSNGFDVPPWALIHENGPVLYRHPGLLQLIDYFSNTTSGGQKLILGVAESQPHQKRPSN